MSGNSVVKSEHAIGGASGRPSGEVSHVLRNGIRISAAVALLACFGVSDLRASQPGMVSSGPVIQRFVRAVPRKYVLSPSGPTVAVNQVQHFGVVDADGKPVAVRWNISGLGCYGASCGSIDERGIYHPPSSVPKPRMVTLEGVVIADPHYSVLTEILLADAVTTNENAKVAELEKPQLSEPQIPNEYGSASRHESLPLPGAVAATPGLERVDVVRATDLIPLPSVVGAAPSVASQGRARHSELPPVPAAVGATPTVAGANGGRNADLAPLPKVIAAAPSVENHGAGRHAEFAAVPSAVAPTPAVKAVKAERTAELVLSPTVVITAPKAPNPAATSSSAGHPAEILALPTAVAAAPGVKRQEPVRIASLLPLPSTDSAPVAPSLTVNTQPMLGTGKQTVAPSSALQPAPNGMVTAAAELMSREGTRVVYRDGQLTIDARNATLADLLKLIAEKTGATIDIPPGSGLERIVEHAGPGTPNDVLTQLLNGSHYNFILVNSPQNPNALAQVLLSLQQESPNPAALPNAVPISLPQAAALTKPPEAAPSAQPVPVAVDVQLPSGDLTPDQRGDFMRQMFKDLREKIQQQTPPPNPPQ